MKKIIFFTILIFTFLIIAQNCLAIGLLLEWPKIGTDGKTLGEESSVPELISYIYTFALAICGITALVSIVYGAAQYAFSAGDSSKASDAKNRITQALLGVVILLFSFLILNTINPDLVKLGFNLPKLPTPQTMSSYPWAQCMVSGSDNKCPSGQVKYINCEEYAGIVNNDRNIIKTKCEDQCKGDTRFPGTKTCTVYTTRAECKPKSNNCVNQ